MVRQFAAKTTKMTSQKCSYGTVKGLYSKLGSSWYHRLLLKTNGKHKTNKKVARSKFKIEPQMSRTVGAAPWETNIRSELWRAVHVSCKGYWQMRVILNFVDRPIELLRHQNAGLSNGCMKPVQSLFSLVSQCPQYYRLAASPLEGHAHSHVRSHTCFAFFTTDFWGKEGLLAV